MTALVELAVIYAGPKLNESGEVIEYERNPSATPDIDEGPDKRPKPTPTPVVPYFARLGDLATWRETNSFESSGLTQRRKGARARKGKPV